jgi:hypothetical protein
MAVLSYGGLRGLVWDNFYMQELWMNAPETIRVACVLGGGMSYRSVCGGPGVTHLKVWVVNTLVHYLHEKCS